MAIKLKLIDANHCPGSCMFLFWIYRVGKGRVYKPDLYIYTGDYCLTDTIKEQLLNLRKSEEVDTVTIVNDNTRTSEEDHGLPTDDEAIAEMKDFIENHRKRCKTLITVKIGADWGMEDLWIRLAREYKTCLYVDETTYQQIFNCMGEDYHKDIRKEPNWKKWYIKYFKMRVRYYIRQIIMNRFELTSKKWIPQKEEKIRLPEDTSYTVAEDIIAPNFEDKPTQELVEPEIIYVIPNFKKCYLDKTGAPYNRRLDLRYSNDSFYNYNM